MVKKSLTDERTMLVMLPVEWHVSEGGSSATVESSLSRLFTEQYGYEPGQFAIVPLAEKATYRDAFLLARKHADQVGLHMKISDRKTALCSFTKTFPDGKKERTKKYVRIVRLATAAHH